MKSEIKPKIKPKISTNGKFPKKLLRERRTFLLQAFVLVILGGLIGGFWGAYSSEKIFKTSFNELEELKSDLEEKNQTIGNLENYDLQEGDNLITAIVKKNSPAVVSIIVTKDVPKLDSFFNDPFFNQFYFEDRNVEPETETQKIGGGTGFIVDETGL